MKCARKSYGHCLPLIQQNIKTGESTNTFVPRLVFKYYYMSHFVVLKNINVNLTSIVCNRTLFESCKGLEGSKGLNCFVSKITLGIPGYGDIKCQGEARSDKKSSYDSAAVQALYELQRLGKIMIKIDDGDVECQGEATSGIKSSLDSAAVQ